MYALIATLLYHYFDEQAIPGIKTLDTPISEEETHDPVEDLPLLDLSKVSFPASPKALNLMKASGLEHVNGKGLILKLMIPEESFLPFMRSNDGTPGIMLSVLIARAIERVHPQHEAPLVSNYVVNARPMLKADETFHNCTNRVIVQGMTVAGSMAQMILDLPDFSTKAKIASQAMAGTYDATTYIVSYVGRWKYPQLGRHIREFWTETPVGPFPLIEVAAVNGRIFVSFLQPFSDRRYYDALLDELKENGIEYVECGSTTVSVAEIKD